MDLKDIINKDTFNFLQTQSNKINIFEENGRKSILGKIFKPQFNSKKLNTIQNRVNETDKKINLILKNLSLLKHEIPKNLFDNNFYFSHRSSRSKQSKTNIILNPKFPNF